jgi:hypothetical protein
MPPSGKACGGECGGRFYGRVCRIKAWKNRLPDAARAVAGRDKSRNKTSNVTLDDTYLSTHPEAKAED